jgi:hypothetical protein
MGESMTAMARRGVFGGGDVYVGHVKDSLGFSPRGTRMYVE